MWFYRYGFFVPFLTGAKTAWDLLEYEKNRKKIVTSCAELDMILEGGFCPKEVTEICKAAAIFLH
jgi:hypothetical protein